MAAVVLRGSDLALLTDPTVRAGIPHLTAAPRTVRWDGTLVRFAGDSLPTAFRGEGAGRSWQLTCVYGATEHADLAALLGLLQTAADAPDWRLLLRTHLAGVVGLDDVTAVVVQQVEVTPQAGAVVSVSFTADAVAWDGT